MRIVSAPCVTSVAIALAVALGVPAGALADDQARPCCQVGAGWTSHRPDGHGPIGVMGDHVHGAGGMVALRYGYTFMSGLLDGRRSVDPAALVADGYEQAPRRMHMHMPMLEVMVAATEQVTVMLMADVMYMTMSATTAGGEHRMTSLGLGDPELSALVRAADGRRQRLQLHAGVALPLGTVDPNHDHTHGEGAHRHGPHGYPMRPGSGTFSLRPGLTYLGQTDRWSWGAQSTAWVRLHRNRFDYRPGHRLEATAWGARRWSDWVSTSVRLAGHAVGPVEGADARLDPAASPEEDPALQAGRRLDLLVGVNLMVRRGLLRDHRFALELGTPIYQSLSGPQMRTRVLTMVGWELGF